MNIKEWVKLETITKNYYTCNLFKVDNDVTIDFGDSKLGFKLCQIFKCGYPNEEIYMHYDYYTENLMCKYSLYEILDSEWIKELNEMNKVHPRHSNKIFEKSRHFIILFEDEVFECIATEYAVFY
ncbi:MAG: hypothetical protein ABIR15_21180 [Chitinophagaceae bacterium]